MTVRATASVPVEPSLVTTYRERGYAGVRGRFSPGDVATWHRECQRLWDLVTARPDDPRVQFRNHTSGERIADRIDPLLDVSPLFLELSVDPRMVEPVGAVLGGPATIMKAKLITKRPGTHGYGLHQDYPYWASLGIPADAMLSVMVAVDAASPDNGALEVWPGLHHARLPAPPDDLYDVDESQLDLDAGELVSLDAGDLLLFHSLVPHRSGPNRSSRPRRAVFLTYVHESYRAAARTYAASGLTGH